MSDTGTYTETRFPPHRTATVDTLELGRQRHLVPVLFEVDVTEARARLRALKAATGEGLSFTGWVVACIGRAVQEHKPVHAMRKGRRGLVIFDDVDISIVVERAVGPGGAGGARGAEGTAAARGESLPMPFVVRRANAKTVREIHDEIRAAQHQPLAGGAVQLEASHSALATRLFFRLPRVLRHLLVWRRLVRDPVFAKRSMGTVVVSSVGSASRGGGSAWGVPISIHPLSFTLGSIARKPAVVGDAVAIREVLCVTLLFDHDVTDGAPVARFVDRFKELIEQAHGLPG